MRKFNDEQLMIEIEVRFSQPYGRTPVYADTWSDIRAYCRENGIPVTFRIVNNSPVLSFRTQDEYLMIKLVFVE